MKSLSAAVLVIGGAILVFIGISMHVSEFVLLGFVIVVTGFAGWIVFTKLVQEIRSLIDELRSKPDER